MMRACYPARGAGAAYVFGFTIDSGAGFEQALEQVTALLSHACSRSRRRFSKSLRWFVLASCGVPWSNVVFLCASARHSRFSALQIDWHAVGSVAMHAAGSSMLSNTENCRDVFMVSWRWIASLAQSRLKQSCHYSSDIRRFLRMP
jgi:hypothetical protein